MLSSPTQWFLFSQGRICTSLLFCQTVYQQKSSIPICYPLHWLLILVWRYFFLKRVGKENLCEWQAGLVWLVDPLNPDPPLTDCSSHTDLLPTVPHFSVYIPHCRPLAQKISRFLQLQLLRYEKCFCDVKEVTSFEEWLLDFSKLLICFKQSTGWSIVPLALFFSNRETTKKQFWD